MPATSSSTAPRSATSPSSSLTDRRILGEEGFISVIVGGQHPRLPGSSAVRISMPAVSSEDDSALDDVRPLLVSALEAALREGVDDSHPAPAGDQTAARAGG